MKVRRVVTGQTRDGKAVIASDSEVDPITFDLNGIWEQYRLWGADQTPTFPDHEAHESMGRFFPPTGGFRFGIFTVPPETDGGAENQDFEKGLKEMEEKLPGTRSMMEPDHPGMHRTDTVDFEYVISGEVWLELDDGEQVHLHPGDTVVQNGTRHAWHNKGTEPCRMVLFMIGANRK